MTSSDGKEIKCTIDTELPWKMAAKGSRSLIRRNKNSVVRVAASDIEAENKSSTDKVAGESDTEKLGDSDLGQQFAERAEQVPFKKRRYMVCFPSLSKSSAQREGSEHGDVLPVSRLNPNIIDGRTSGILTEEHECSAQDFSGIKILADVACNSDMSNDIAPAVESLPAKEFVVQQQDVATLTIHVEGKDSSAGTAYVSQKYTADVSTDQAEVGKNGIVATQKSLADQQSVEHSRVASEGMIVAKKTSMALSDESSTERPKANAEVSKSENLAPDSGAATVSEKSVADDPTEQSNEGLKDVKFHWDLNVPMDAWGQPCDVEDEVSGRNVEGKITESIACNESEPISESKDQIDGGMASDGDAIVSSPSGPKPDDAGARNEKECQSGYDSQFEDGELREPYPWEESDGDVGEVELLDYGSEPDDERFYSMVDNDDNKMEVSEQEILAEMKLGDVECESGNALRIGEGNEGSDIEKPVVVYTRDSHPKVSSSSSSPSRSFGSKPFKEFTSHNNVIHKRSFRPNSYREFSTGEDNFSWREDRSGMRMRHRSPGREYFSGWDSRLRFAPRNYKGDSYGFGRPRPKSMMDGRDVTNDFDQSGSGPGYGSGSDGHVRRQFSNGGYRGRYRRFPDGGNRDFRGQCGDTNLLPSSMHDRMSGNRRDRGNSPVFRISNYQQSDSRSRSRSPVSWNRRNRSSPHSGGFRSDKRMDGVRFGFQKRFPADQETGFISPPRNRMSPKFFEGKNNDGGENHNTFRERKFGPGQRFVVRNPMKRFNSDNSNNNHFRPLVRSKRLHSVEENTGGNRFEMPKQRTRQPEGTEDGAGDDVRRFRFYGEQSVVANNNNES